MPANTTVSDQNLTAVENDRGSQPEQSRGNHARLIVRDRLRDSCCKARSSFVYFHSRRRQGAHRFLGSSMVERSAVNRNVAGSSPARGARNDRGPRSDAGPSLRGGLE